MTPTTIGENELRTCPFCGSAGMSGTTLDGSGYAMCVSEGCWGMTGYLPTEAEAIAAWNRRSSGPGTVSVKPEITDAMVAAAMTEFVASVRKQDPDWTDESGEEGEILLTSPNGDYFALEFPIRDAVKSCLTSIGVEAGKWQTIDSAPKDGREFQAWLINRGGRGFWEPRGRINPDTEAFEMFGRVDYDEDGWSVYPELTPTHWQPLPAAPEASS